MPNRATKHGFTLEISVLGVHASPVLRIWSLCFRPGQQSTVYPTAPAGLIFPGERGCTPSGYVTHYGHVGPRIGFARSPGSGWVSGGPGKRSVRGGLSIYFNRPKISLTYKVSLLLRSLYSLLVLELWTDRRVLLLPLRTLPVQILFQIFSHTRYRPPNENRTQQFLNRIWP